MSSLAGDILELGYSNDEVGSGVFYPKSGEDSTMNAGGFNSADDSSNVDGAGQPIRVMNRVLTTLTAVIANDTQNRNDFENARALKESTADTTWTVTHISGTVYEVTGYIAGDLEENKNAGTFELTIVGTKAKRIE
jgi:hypothetical protein